ncbi:MAG: hypothetical protein ACK5RL_10615 [Acidimicrobiales bacterium]
MTVRTPMLSVFDFSEVPHEAALHAVRAVNRQIWEDFFPIWGCGWNLRLDEPSFDPTGITLEQLDDETPEPVQADGVLYLVDAASLNGALGYHIVNTIQMPVGFVFTDTIEHWSVTLSHEALEMIVDPMLNLFAPGPSPRPADRGRLVLHTYEVCDVVETFSYEIDGVRVSDFVTPRYFVDGGSPRGRNDFLGLGLRSFAVMPDCHALYFDIGQGDFAEYREVGQSSPSHAKREHAADLAASLRIGRRRPTDVALDDAVFAYNRAAQHLRTVGTLGRNFAISRTAQRSLRRQLPLAQREVLASRPRVAAPPVARHQTLGPNGAPTSR